MSQNQKQSSNQTPPTIALTGGGSGGHITPLLSLAHALKRLNPGCRVVYIGLKGEKVKGLKERYKVFDDVFYISAGKLRRYHSQGKMKSSLDIKTHGMNVKDMVKVVAGTNTSEKILKKIKPDVVFSKGGYVAVPVGIAANWQKIPIVTHDSDTVPGLANKIIGRWATIHATGMPAEQYSYPKDSIRYTGIPVDERIKRVSPKIQDEFKQKLNIPVKNKVLLAAGGGQGSQRINRLMLYIAPELLLKHPDLSVIHFVGINISGQQSREEIENEYKAKLPPEEYSRLHVIDFADNFYEYSGAADLIITRSGATALAEFGLQQKACITIPNPHLANGHQLKNSKELKKAEAVEVFIEDSPPEDLLSLVLNLLKDNKRRDQLSENLANLAKPNASEDLAKILLEVAKGQG